MKRAHEVEAANPIVAYYCSFYSLRRAVELRDKQDEVANRFVTGLLEKCDAQKAAIGPDPGTHRGIVEEFALNVFDQADSEDREGRATRDTAVTFYAAMCFMEVCCVFATLTPDLEERIRYAKWKASQILKALREGQTPAPGIPAPIDPADAAQADPSALPPPMHPHQPHAASPHATPSSLALLDAAAPASSTASPAAAAAAYPPPTGPGAGVGGAPELKPGESGVDDTVPPAPEVREYESDLQEYQPAPDGPSTTATPDAYAYPLAAPPYPSSEDPSPLPTPRDAPPANPYPTSLPPPAFAADPPPIYAADPPPVYSAETPPMYGADPPPVYAADPPPMYAADPPTSFTSTPPPHDMGHARPYYPSGPAPPPQVIPMPPASGAVVQLADQFGNSMHLGGGKPDPGAMVALPPVHSMQMMPPPAYGRVANVGMPPGSMGVQPGSLGMGPAHSTHLDGGFPLQGGKVHAAHGAPLHTQALSPSHPPMHSHPPPKHPSPHMTQHEILPQANYRPNVSDFIEAQRFARHAVSAIDFQDVAGAILNLEKALRLMTG